MKKPRILIYSLAYDPYIGGAELAVQEVTNRLGEKYEFDLLTYRFSAGDPKEERIGNVRVLRFGAPLPTEQGAHYGHKWKKLVWAGKALLKSFPLHRKHRYDMTWAIMANYAAAPAFWFKIFRPSVPLLLTLQEGDSEEHIRGRVGRAFILFWERLFKLVDYVQVISSYLKEFALKYGTEAPITVVPNGVDVDTFKNPVSEHKKGERWTVVTTSRLVKKNGVDTLIKAVAQLNTDPNNTNTSELSQHSNHLEKSLDSSNRVQLRIVGSGPQEKELRELVSRLNLDNIVTFVGEVPFKRIPEELQHADIFARISRSEGLGSSFLEAMAAGLPVVGTPVGGIPDFLEDKETGLFAKVDDPRDVAQKIQLLIEDDDLRGTIAKNGQELVENEYTWDSVAKRMNTIFTKVTSTKPEILNPKQ